LKIASVVKLSTERDYQTDRTTILGFLNRNEEVMVNGYGNQDIAYVSKLIFSLFDNFKSCSLQRHVDWGDGVEKTNLEFVLKPKIS
jgi:hypothetical protein